MHTSVNCVYARGPASLMMVGTTATVALLRDGIELVVGSAGDSRALLCRKGKVRKLTDDHTPERKDEKHRYTHTHSHSQTHTSAPEITPSGMCRDRRALSYVLLIKAKTCNSHYSSRPEETCMQSYTSVHLQNNFCVSLK